MTPDYSRETGPHNRVQPRPSRSEPRGRIRLVGPNPRNRRSHLTASNRVPDDSRETPITVRGANDYRVSDLDAVRSTTLRRSGPVLRATASTASNRVHNRVQISGEPTASVAPPFTGGQTDPRAAKWGDMHIVKTTDREGTRMRFTEEQRTRAAEALRDQWVRMVQRDHQEGDDRRLTILVDIDTVAWGDGGQIASRYFVDIALDALAGD